MSCKSASNYIVIGMAVVIFPAVLICAGILWLKTAAGYFESYLCNSGRMPDGYTVAADGEGNQFPLKHVGKRIYLSYSR